MKRKKILIAINCMNVGGAPAVVLSHLKLIDTKKYEPWVITLYRSKQANYMNQVREIVGDNVVEFALHNRSPLDIFTAAKIYFFLLKQRFSIVMTHLFLANTLVRVLSIFSFVPTIISFEHSLYSEKKKLHIAIDKTLSFFTKTIVVAHPHIASFTAKQENIPEDKFTVISHPVSVPEKSKEDMRVLWGIPKERMLLACVGRFSTEKGQEVLLNALTKVAGKDFFVILVGHGSKGKLLERRIEELSLRDVCKVVYDPINAKQAYHIADAIVIPSYREGFSLVAAEAISAQVPVIASNIPTLSYIKEVEAGLFFEPGNEEELAVHISKFVSEDKTRNHLKEAVSEIELSFEEGAVRVQLEKLISKYV